MPLSQKVFASFNIESVLPNILLRDLSQGQYFSEVSSSAPKPSPGFEAEEYVGSYSELAYGDVSLVAAADNLKFNYYDNHWILVPTQTPDEFILSASPDGSTEDFPVRFNRASGKITGLAIPLEPEVDPIVFVKK